MKDHELAMLMAMSWAGGYSRVGRGLNVHKGPGKANAAKKKKRKAIQKSRRKNRR